jgi:senataxin
MQDMRKEYRVEAIERRREIGGITNKLPPASGLGTGLGAYTGSRPVPVVVKSTSSGSSASESSDDEGEGLSALIRQKSPKKIKVIPAVERRPIKILGTSNAEIIQQQTDRRTAQLNIKKRLKPDLNPLFRHILSWDPDHTGQTPPHHPKSTAELGPLTTVPVRFGDSQQYERVMLPLFLQELWFQTMKDQKASLPVPVEVSTRTYEDDFLDIELSVPGQCPPGFQVNDMDVVVLRQQGGGMAKPVFGRVLGFRRRGKEANIKVRLLALIDQRELAGKSKWLLYKQLK